MTRKTPFQKDLANSKKTGNKKSPVKKIKMDPLKYFTGKKFSSYNKKKMGGFTVTNRFSDRMLPNKKKTTRIT